MKKTIKLLTLAFVLFATACNNDDEMDMLNSLWRNITQNEARIDDLEKWCAQANTNITSLQTIVNVIESNDAITSITPMMEGGVEVGYTITFADHDPITIYHGKDGKDGQNGADGQDGASPIVGVAKYTDGVYYWTLNGEWLLDENGNKLRVSGEDGANGENGQNGTNGTNGQNGITPQLKIENDYWWISYDNGSTWTQLGKAKGEDGADGQDGATGAQGDKGDAGDSMFQSVTQDADNVYFTLADGTVITIAKGGGGADDGGYIFTITYMPNGGEGEVVVDTVFYGESYTIKSYAIYNKENDCIESWNTDSNGNGTDFEMGRVINAVTRNITLYAQWFGGYMWVDLGLPSGLKWAAFNVGANSPEVYGDRYAWGETETKATYSWKNYKWCECRRFSEYGNPIDFTKYCTSSSYGTIDRKTVLEPEDDAAIVNWGGAWRMPTYEECKELKDNCTWIYTADYKGTGVGGLIGISNFNANFVFIPGDNNKGYYSSTLGNSSNWVAYVFRVLNSSPPLHIGESNTETYERYNGYYIRPVCE